MQRLAANDAEDLKKNIQENIDDSCTRIIVLTHVPPFKEVAFHRGKVSDPEYLIYYTSKTTGDMLLELALKYPHINFEVYCGHTHGAATYKAADNLQVECGGAEYSRPHVQKLIGIESNEQHLHH
jgi:hypothetical protein